MMQKEITIRVEPGGDAVLLYSDDSPLAALPGRREMARASHVEWSTYRQRWIIRMPGGDQIGNPEGYESRMMAIADEVQILNKMLAEGYTGFDIGFRATGADMLPL
jgi:hypothetical protein